MTDLLTGEDAVREECKRHTITVTPVVSARGLDHTELPRHLSRAEDIATWLGEMLGGGPVKVEVWREAEGMGATWTA